MKHPTALQIVLISLALCYAPHMHWLPVWVSVFCLSLWLIRFLSEVKGWKAPGRLYLYGLTLLALVGAILTQGITFYGRDIGTSLLALMLAIKPFEIKNYRDRMVTIFLSLFLLFTTLLFSQHLFLGLYLFIGLVLIMAALIAVNQTRFQIQPSLVQAFLLCLQALPLAVLCFFLFPRLPGALIGLQSNQISTSGLSDTLSPGSFSQLSLSQAIAFRAEFEGSPPQNKDLYWRAAVLWDFNGTVWSKGPAVELKRPQTPSGPQPKRYRLSLEPSGKTMLPALDYPVRVPEKTRMLSGLTLETKKKIRSKTHYQLSSVPSPRTPSFSPDQRRRGLRLNRSRNPETQRLMKTLAPQLEDPAQVAEKVLKYFREQPFSYTLSPPPLRSSHTVDEFLFRTRSGYCSHFAQAFAWMMRSAGIPSRIVVGYQGGEQNPLGDYLIVRQSDAHAWVEILLPGQGWVRTDPTQAVAPERIDSGIQHFLAQSGDRSMFLISDDHWIMKFGHSLRLSWDALNYHWYTWVVDYTLSRQNRLFSRLRLGDNVWHSLEKVILILTLSCLFFALIFAALLLPARSGSQDSLKRSYSLFLKKIRKAGILHLPHEGPKDLALRISREGSHLARDASEICDLYIQLRYGDSRDRSLARRFRKRIRALHWKRPLA